MKNQIFQNVQAHTRSRIAQNKKSHHAAVCFRMLEAHDPEDLRPYEALVDALNTLRTELSIKVRQTGTLPKKPIPLILQREKTNCF